MWDWCQSALLGSATGASRESSDEGVGAQQRCERCDEVPAHSMHMHGLMLRV